MMLPIGLALTLASGVAPALGRWATVQERRILAAGEPLPEAAQAFAGQLGIENPAGLRMLVVNPIPLPLPEPALALAIRWGLPVFRPGGMCVGRGIYLLPGQLSSLPHELVHTLQYQQFGGTGPFMRRYVTECLRYGYANAPLEEEAEQRSRIEP